MLALGVACMGPAALSTGAVEQTPALIQELAVLGRTCGCAEQTPSEGRSGGAGDRCSGIGQLHGETHRSHGCQETWRGLSGEVSAELELHACRRGRPRPPFPAGPPQQWPPLELLFTLASRDWVIQTRPNLAGDPPSLLRPPSNQGKSRRHASSLPGHSHLGTPG